MGGKKWMKGWGTGSRPRLRRIMRCLRSGEHLRADEMVPSSESLATRDYSASGYSSRAGESEHKPDNSNIEEAESSLRESGCLNYEEARALLGRLEYQKGNVEAALHVFDGIDIAAVTPKMKLCIARRGNARRGERRKRPSQNDDAPLMSMHAVSLLFEAIFLKAKSLQALGRYREAAQSCKVILDTVESALPEGLPENFGTDCKLQETLNKAVELLPELWKLAGNPHEAISSYRRALLHHWNLDTETTARIQKQFAIFLLYAGTDASPPNLRYQVEGSFVPRNNIEEAVLLLMILLRSSALKRIEWDPSIIDHLCYGLSVSGALRGLAGQVEELLPGVFDRKERYYILSLCYYGEGDDVVALNLLRKLLSKTENPNCIQALLLASKICGENPDLTEEGVDCARRALAGLQGGCDQMGSAANHLLGVSLSAQARSAVSDSERITKQSEALKALETAERTMKERDPTIIYHLSLENADQRKLDAALYYAKQLLKLEAGSNVKGWILLARILSAHKWFPDAETVVDAALDQTGKWSQGELLRTKAKLQIAQGQLINAVETFSHLLAILQVQNKISGVQKNLLKGSGSHDRNLELEIWHDLAKVYISMSQWRDAEVCLSKSKAIALHSASGWHTTGLLYKAKGLHKEALKAFTSALNVEAAYVPSLVSTANILRRQGTSQSMTVARSFLTEALRLDRTNSSAWYNLGMLYKDKAKGGDAASLLEATECFEAADLLEESEPVEPFR
ncbi:Tetratricopeptide repeat-containing domain [Macleaya cordata]|uniref:Tetratricopeptide repeat-containing domain n=1 Tax=Macleaya cordata TaxID=56857 RepID=A0A200PVU5_MACCD|nr:Tetratricopeptide repeat-containing domain [Macleaya cordata]